MKPALDTSGYLRTMIVRNGRPRTVKIHRLIAEVWLNNPKGLPEVNHINGCKMDNRACNLEWVTRQQNMKHCFDIGLASNKGVSNPISKLTDEQVREIRATYVRRRGNRELFAKKYNVGVATIKDVVLGKSWRHLL